MIQYTAIYYFMLFKKAKVRQMKYLRFIHTNDNSCSPFSYIIHFISTFHTKKIILVYLGRNYDNIKIEN